MNPNLDVICGLCNGIIPKCGFNTHLYNHHQITTDRGIRHQQLMELPVDTTQETRDDSLSSRKSSVVFNLSNQGYDPDIYQLLKDKNFSDALDILKAR